MLPAPEGYERPYLFLGTVGESLGGNRWRLDVKNPIREGETIEYLGPDVLSLPDGDFRLEDEEGRFPGRADHNRPAVLRTDRPIAEGYLIRKPLP